MNNIRFYRLIVVALIGLNLIWMVDTFIQRSRAAEYRERAHRMRERAESYHQNLEYLQSSLQAARTLVRCIDGDTIELDGGERVRIIGVNVPETWQKTKAGGWKRIEKPDPRAIAARDFVRSFEGCRLRLTYEKQKKDRYGRTLAHIYVIDHNIDLGCELIKRGHAKPMAIKPNIKRYMEHKELAAAEKK